LFKQYWIRQYPGLRILSPLSQWSAYIITRKENHEGLKYCARNFT
jgi:hypothetical protein